MISLLFLEKEEGGERERETSIQHAFVNDLSLSPKEKVICLWNNYHKLKLILLVFVECFTVSPLLHGTRKYN